MTSATDDSPLDGGCTCRAVRYRLQSRPPFVNCCHCSWCQRETGSNYAGAGESVRFVRVGTLDQPARLPPDIHIYTSTKLPWVVLPAGVPAVPEYYDSKRYWPAESLERRTALRARAGG